MGTLSRYARDECRARRAIQVWQRALEDLHTHTHTEIDTESARKRGKTRERPEKCTGDATFRPNLHWLHLKLACAPQIGRGLLSLSLAHSSSRRSFASLRYNWRSRTRARALGNEARRRKNSLNLKAFPQICIITSIQRPWICMRGTQSFPGFSSLIAFCICIATMMLALRCDLCIFYSKCRFLLFASFGENRLFFLFLKLSDCPAK